MNLRLCQLTSSLSVLSCLEEMNEEWKKKYYFDDKSKVIESPMPSTMPCNVSPFVKRDDYKETSSSGCKVSQDRRSSSSSVKKGNGNCTIA